MQLCKPNAPFVIAGKRWDNEFKSVPFAKMVEWCISFGVFHSDRESLLMARPWRMDTDIWLDAKPYDTWFIWYASGRGMRRFFGMAPFTLPKVAFYRRNRPVWYYWDTLTKKIK